MLNPLAGLPLRYLIGASPDHVPLIVGAESLVCIN